MNESHDKQSGGRSFAKGLRDMTDAELEYFIKRIASESGEEGARKAFSKLGLDDEMAPADIKAIRGMIAGVRFVRVKAASTALSGLGKMCGWALLIFFILTIEHYFPSFSKKFSPETAEVFKP